jgi:malate dehydrogenase (oxaloacetate-decarboxylating)(NADP+)
MDTGKINATEDEALQFHAGGRPGKLSIAPHKPLVTQRDLSLAYSPGVAYPCLRIQKDPSAAFDYTSKGNFVAVVSNGTAVLGLGDLGALAAKPVMEGKAALFKRFADIDSIDLEIDTKDVDEFVNCVRFLHPSFGGINLEDIRAPECFVIEERLRELLDIPVFHDDQHGTAIVVLAALANALRVVEKDAAEVKVVVVGAGAAGVACTEIMLAHGVGNITVCDIEGVLYAGRPGLDPVRMALAARTNPTGERGMANDVLPGADVLVGVSGPGAVTEAAVRRMAPRAIVFAMANPEPEVRAEEVGDAVAIMATGRSDYPNQINNVLAFPGVFRGALDVRARTINEEMKLAAAQAIAGVVADDQLDAEYIIPSVFNREVVKAVALAVARAAEATGVARRPAATAVEAI